ncbi:hypothetical protein [Streptomyces sp. cmx-4-9]|uniref:hypothetical protein n=1 Tax=Streptomyces sp. cmx-4-9 TaxID=2790941 RepID=UPI00397F3FD6
MNREQEPGYGSQAPPPEGWHAGPASGAAPSGAGGGSSHRTAWIGAGATMVAAVITVFGAYLLTPGKSAAPSTPPAAQPPAAPSPSDVVAAPASAPAPAAPEASGGTPAAGALGPSPAPKTAGTVRWEGSLVIAYAEDKDLDAQPPTESEVNSDNDFSVFEFAGRKLRPERGAKALVWTDTGTTPSYADCAAAVETRGTGKEISLKTGITVCAKTNEGKVARLTAKETAGQASDTRGTFDVVVWQG